MQDLQDLNANDLFRILDYFFPRNLNTSVLYLRLGDCCVLFVIPEVEPSVRGWREILCVRSHVMYSWRPLCLQMIPLHWKLRMAMMPICCYVFMTAFLSSADTTALKIVVIKGGMMFMLCFQHGNLQLVMYSWCPFCLQLIPLHWKLRVVIKPTLLSKLASRWFSIFIGTIHKLLYSWWPFCLQLIPLHWKLRIIIKPTLSPKLASC